MSSFSGEVNWLGKSGLTPPVSWSASTMSRYRFSEAPERGFAGRRGARLIPQVPENFLPRSRLWLLRCVQLVGQAHNFRFLTERNRIGAAYTIVTLHRCNRAHAWNLYLLRNA